MSRRKTTAEFIQEAQAAHGDLYDYSKVEYTGGKIKVLIIDPEYGEFWQAAGSHLSGQGNPIRGKKKSENSRRKNTEQFIEEAKDIHGTLYDYSKVDYTNANTKVLIIDPKYGEFWQTPDSHLSGSGNIKRGRELARKSLSKSPIEFVREARAIHGNLYDYSKVDYVNTDTKVLIIDPKYGEFWQTPYSHLRGSVHPTRGRLKSDESRRKTNDKFILEARAVHRDLYDYSKVEYKTTHTKILIIDPEYGEFWQTPCHHLDGQGHPLRGIKNRADKQRGTTNDFINKAIQTHGDFYDYSKVEYMGNKSQVLIIDPEYGEFWQTPDSHLSGSGNIKRATEESRIKRTKSLDEFLNDARQIHGDLYDYSEVEYNGSHNKISITCSKHGLFYQTPTAHLRGQGCPKCVGKNKSTDDFVEQARLVHGDLYDYSQTEYISSHRKLLIIDPEYGEFWQSPTSHLGGAGSPARNGGVKLTNSLFIKKAKEVHGDLYDYSRTEYINSKVKVLIIDPEYGKFWQDPSSHLQGVGCPRRTSNVTPTNEEFISRAVAIHGDLYDYSKVEIVTMENPITIIDPEYGEFKQRPDVHLRGSGHPKRAHYGFDLNKPAILYYLRINNGAAYKIGITGQSLVERFRDDMQYIDVVRIWEYKVGEDAYIKEQKILSDYVEFKYTGDYLLKSGNTELFNKDILELDV